MFSSVGPFLKRGEGVEILGIFSIEVVFVFVFLSLYENLPYDNNN